MSLGFLTRVVQLQLNEAIRSSAFAMSMSHTAAATLELIEANPGIRQVQMARILLIQESNLAVIVKEFIAAGLIDRRSMDGRKRGGLWITEEGGRRLARESRTHVLNRTYTRGLSEKEYDQLVSLLNRAYRAGLE